MSRRLLERVRVKTDELTGAVELQGLDVADNRVRERLVTALLAAQVEGVEMPQCEDEREVLHARPAPTRQTLAVDTFSSTSLPGTIALRHLNAN